MIAGIIESMYPELLMDFEERAAIIEYDGCMPRDLAERLALIEVLENAV